MCPLEPCQRLYLYRRVTHHGQQCLVAPHVALEGGDVEVADHDGRLAKSVGPAGHALDEVEFLAKLRILRSIRDVAASRDINVLQPDPAFQADTNVTRLAVVLPIVLA